MRLPACYLTIILVLAAPLSATAEKSVLRVMCEGEDVGAEVTVNGKFKGECPVDIQVSPGRLLLRVEKNDASYERIFEQEVRIGDGVVKKVEVTLSRRLNAAGQQREAQRQAAEREDDAKRKLVERQERYKKELAQYNYDVEKYDEKVKASKKDDEKFKKMIEFNLQKCIDDRVSFFGVVTPAMRKCQKTVNGWVEERELNRSRQIIDPKPVPPDAPQ